MSEGEAGDAVAARVGTALNAKWTIDAVLGVGGMATVYAATHRNRSRGALKVLHAEIAADRALRDRFLREGRIANLVDHPARVPILDDDVSDRGEPFLVMELLVGATLGETLRARGGTLPIEETLATFEVVLDMLAACHAKGVVHRDVKPANVFLTSAGAVRVLDFGVARLREREAAVEATRVGTALGTPSFMAPEQALGHDAIDGRADLFSVGACMYTCLTGQRLHAAENETEAYLKSATQAAPSIARAAPDLPPSLVAFVDRALAFDRGRRFPDAETMRAELSALLASARDGTLLRAAPKRAAGIVVRGEVVEATEAPAPTLSKEKLRDRLGAIFKSLGAAITAIRQYGWVHPTSAKALSMVFDEVAAVLAEERAGIAWEVTPSMFAVDGVPVFAPDRPPLDRIPYLLFADGIRRIHLKPGLELDELRDFLGIVMREEGDASEDDSVTALWDRRFHHIAYFAIDSFAEGDEAARGDFEAQSVELADRALETSHLDRDWDDGSLEAQSTYANLSGALGLDEVRDAALALSVDALTRTALAAQVAPSAEAWTERYVESFVDAWREGVRGGDLDVLTDALRDWTADQIALHAYETTFRTFGALAKAFADVAEPAVAKGLERRLARIMFPLDALRALLIDLGKGTHGADDAMARGLSRALSVLDSDAVFGLALECYEGSGDEPLRFVLLGYLKKWLPGHERALEPLLMRAPADRAVPLLRLLGAIEGEAAQGAIEPAFASPHLEVRLEALARLRDASGPRVRDELGRMYDEAQGPDRARILQLVVRMQLATAGPVLALRVQNSSFHGLPIDERRALLETVWRLNPRRGEALALEVLEEKRIVATKAVDESRLLAAETLGKAATGDAIAPLAAAAKSRWFSSAALREAALKAIEAIKAREARGVGP